jgi:hypothetical protein
MYSNGGCAVTGYRPMTLADLAGRLGREADDRIARRLPVRQGPGSGVNDPGDVLLARSELEHAFTALGERLARRHVVADIFVVGGAAMALAYDADRVTRDVDATFVPHGIVAEEARQVADDLGLPCWWLNEQASVYISGKDDLGKRRVFDHPGLRVMAASPDHIFAMKPSPPGHAT